ncbi:hypothetical protein [Acidithiobacillus sp.]|uniref:hypothetical protein n=1 Tax=Acidithiobacillus sp. TaxID=1872118 RepID=UPI0032AFE81B
MDFGQGGIMARQHAATSSGVGDEHAAREVEGPLQPPERGQRVAVGDGRSE